MGKTAVENISMVLTPLLYRRSSDDNNNNSSKRERHRDTDYPRWKDSGTGGYRREMKAYEGYYLSRSNVVTCCGGTRPTCPNSEFVIAAAEYAIEFYNKSISGGVALKLMKVIRSNKRGCSCYTHFLTLAASDGRFYETQVLMRRGVGVEVATFRPAKHYPVLKPIKAPCKPMMNKNKKRRF